MGDEEVIVDNRQGLTARQRRQRAAMDEVTDQEGKAPSPKKGRDAKEFFFVLLVRADEEGLVSYVSMYLWETDTTDAYMKVATLFIWELKNSMLKKQRQAKRK